MPGLADLIESGEIDGARVEGMLATALAAPLASGVDEVALGCTHYGFLRPVLERLLPPGVEVLDAAEPVARRVLHQLAAHHLTVPVGAARAIDCAATGDLGAFATTLARLRAAGADLPPLTMLTASEAR